MKKTTYPDLDASTSSPTEQIKWLKEYGVVVLRQALATQELKTWLPAFKETFSKTDRAFMTGQMQHGQYQQLYRYGHPRPEDNRHSARWQEWLFQQSLFQQFLRAYYQNQVWILEKNSLPRRQQTQSPDRAIAFHQDYEFTGSISSGLNCWIPLSPAGRDDPGLEIWLKSPQKPYFHLSQSSLEREQLSKQIIATELWHPHLKPGDLLIMTLFTVHRTYLPPISNRIRYSYELRLIGKHDHNLTSSPLIERTL